MQRKPRATAPLHWDDVRLFLALGRARTVGGAAQTLGVDASTVSRRLTALEEAMAITLFDRGRDGVTATKAAEDLMGIAEEIEAAMHRFAHAADGLEREVAGLVRIACPPDVADAVVLPLLQGLLARHPGLRIAIDPGEAIVDLTRREADLALRTVRPTRGDLVATRLLPARWVLAATPAVAERLGKLSSWRDAPWIAWGERLAHLHVARWLVEHGRDVDPIVRSDSMTVQIAAVRAGIGVALLPATSLEHYELVPVKLAAGLRDDAAAWPTDELFLVTHRALREVPRVRAVWERLVERLAERTRAAR